MTEIRCWTVRQPWACAMFVAPKGFEGIPPKDVENRTRQVSYRGLVAIHTGAKFAEKQDSPQWEMACASFDSAPPELKQPSAVLGFVRLVDSHGSSRGCCASAWGEPWPEVWHNALTEQRAFVEPIGGVRGALPLWHPAGPLLAEIKRAMDVALSVPGGTR